MTQLMSLGKLSLLVYVLAIGFEPVALNSESFKCLLPYQATLFKNYEQFLNILKLYLFKILLQTYIYLNEQHILPILK